MLEQKQKRIKDHDYVYRPLSATPALRLFTKLVKTAGPAFAALSSAKDDPGAALSRAADALTSSLDEDAVESIVKAFVSQTLIDNKPLATVYEVEMADMGALLSFLSFAIEAQFGNFFSASKSAGSAFFGASPTLPTPTAIQASPSGG